MNRRRVSESKYNVVYKDGSGSLGHGANAHSHLCTNLVNLYCSVFEKISMS